MDGVPSDAMLNRIRFGLEIRRRYAAERRDTVVQKRDADWMLRELTARGPVMIKLGQFISSRGDIFEAPLVRSLRGLQDQVPPMDRMHTTRIMQDAVGISSYDATPFASASVGQVHIGYLTSGQIVAIKIRRPDIREHIESEVDTLCALLRPIGVLAHVLHDAEMVRSVDSTRRIAQDFKHVMLMECDYVAEAESLALYSGFDQRELSRAWVSPNVFRELCTQDRIVMDFVPSIRLDLIVPHLTPLDRALLANQVMDMYVSHMLVHNVAHCDLHPGNVGIDSCGRIVIYDFGNVARLPPTLVSSFEAMLVPLMDEDVDAMIGVLEQMDVIKVRDPIGLRRYVELFVRYVRGAEFKSFALSELDVQALRSSKLPVEIDGVVFRLLRGAMLAEGLCKSIHGDFTYAELIHKYAMKLASKDGRLVWLKVRADLEALLSASSGHLRVGDGPGDLGNAIRGGVSLPQDVRDP